MNKVLPLFAAIAMVIFFSSCEKSKIKNCVEDMEGSYSGTSICASYQSAGNLTVSASSANDDQVIINFDGDNLIATVDDDCNLVIDSQVITDSYGYQITYTGTGSFDEGDLDLTLNLTQGSLGLTCTLDAMKL